ncbi:MAG: Vgb family protein [Gammaproteobacteria bacterium]
MFRTKRLALILLTIGYSFFCTVQAQQPIAPEILVQGTSIHGATGIRVGRDGLLYVASVVGRSISVMDPRNGKILRRLGPEQGVESPDDLAFGPDGSLYWASLLTGEVGRLSPDGVKTGQLVAPGADGITFSDDGRLFVALDFLGDGLYEVDPNFVVPPAQLISTPGFLNAMDFGPDGNLYGPIWTRGKVVRIDVNSKAVTTVADGFSIPAAVKFDSRGRLHALDTVTGELVRVDTATGTKKVIARLVPGVDNLAFDSQDRIYVSNVQDSSIVEVLPGGKQRIVSPSGLMAPSGIAVMPGSDGKESIFVADFLSLRQFDGESGRSLNVDRSFVGVPGISVPITISSDGTNLISSSWFSNEVQVWNPVTHQVLETNQNFPVPLNAIRFGGDLIVVELGRFAGSARVVRATPSEQITLADAADGLVVPAGLAAADGKIWVSDRATGKVLQITANGIALDKPVEVARDLANPEGLAIDRQGSLLVVESSADRLSRINLATGEVSTVADGMQIGAEGSPGTPPTWAFNGVAVGPSGAIYVTGGRGNVVYRLKPKA